MMHILKVGRWICWYLFICCWTPTIKLYLYHQPTRKTIFLMFLFHPFCPGLVLLSDFLIWFRFELWCFFYLCMNTIIQIGHQPGMSWMRYERTLFPFVLIVPFSTPCHVNIDFIDLIPHWDWFRWTFCSSDCKCGC